MTVGREGNKHNKTPEKEIRKTTKREIWKEAEHGRKKKKRIERHRYSNSSRRCRSLFSVTYEREKESKSNPYQSSARAPRSQSLRLWEEEGTQET